MAKDKSIEKIHEQFKARYGIAITESKAPRGHVWVLSGGWDYEGSTVLGVFTDVNKLQKAEAENSGFDYITVELLNVNG